MATVTHTRSGNCWERAYRCRRCGTGLLCDVCHDHDAPRGECRECKPCDACQIENRGTDGGIRPVTTPTPETARCKALIWPDDCANCGCRKEGHRGPLVGCEGAGGTCKCPGYAPRPSPPVQTTETDQLTLAEIAEKAEAYARELGSIDALRFALENLAMLVRAAAVPVSEPDGHTPFDRMDQHASAESDPAFRALVRELVEAVVDAEAEYPPTPQARQAFDAAHAAVLAAHAKVVASLARARKAWTAMARHLGPSCCTDKDENPIQCRFYDDVARALASGGDHG